MTLTRGWLGLPCQVHERVAALSQQRRRRDLGLLAPVLKLQRDRSVADTQRLLQPVHGSTGGFTTHAGSVQCTRARVDAF